MPGRTSFHARKHALANDAACEKHPQTDSVQATVPPFAKHGTVLAFGDIMGDFDSDMILFCHLHVSKFLDDETQFFGHPSIARTWTVALPATGGFLSVGTNAEAIVRVSTR